MKRFFLFLLFLISIAHAAAEPNFSRVKALQDGFMLDGLDGKITSNAGLWYFSSFESLTDGKGSLSPATKVQILPSGMLEKLSAAVSEKNNSFRIWGKFTEYKYTNFVYVSYFVPVTQVNEPLPETDYSEPNEEKIIPDDVMALLRPKRIINLAELAKPLSTEADGLISDRTGFLKKTGNDFYFAFDALGRKIDSLSLPLLKCKALEEMEIQQNRAAEPLRFGISAIVTSYKGKNYMLLQRAERAYNHGNFAR